jgi:hypothetical protein
MSGLLDGSGFALEGGGTGTMIGAGEGCAFPELALRGLLCLAEFCMAEVACVDMARKPFVSYCLCRAKCCPFRDDERRLT